MRDSIEFIFHRHIVVTIIKQIFLKIGRHQFETPDHPHPLFGRIPQIIES